MIVKQGAFQRSIFLSSANVVTGHIYQTSSTITSYIGLKSENESLIEQLAEKENRIQYLETFLKEYHDSINIQTILSETLDLSHYSFYTARVINNTISRVDNFITLNKGRLDGLAPDMGVLSADGVVGIVQKVSDHFAVVLPILNSKFVLSCKIQRNNHFGPLVWDGTDPRYAWLNEYPKHVTFNIGDTIITSGYSDIFPAGIMVGTVVDSEKENNDNSYSLKVALAADFYSLKEVLVVNNKFQQEQFNLEKSIEKK